MIRKSIILVLVIILLMTSCTKKESNTGIDNLDNDVVSVIIKEDTIEELESVEELEEAEEIKASVVYVFADILNVREGNSIEYEVIDQVYEYNLLKVLDKKNDSDGMIWYLIKTYDGIIGWIAGWYCEALQLDEGYDELITGNGTNYEAWLGLTEAYMRMEAYQEAGDTLIDTAKQIIENYDEADEVLLEAIEAYKLLVDELVAKDESIVCF
ncbi:MAG: SH3 domain-containing protein, partial [Vallitaleaceae bacterium]|nr:SH3 domain-containing protein [Vallitaleaceae bacterium]